MTELRLDALRRRDSESTQAAEGKLTAVGAHRKGGLERTVTFNRRQSDRNHVISRSRASKLSSVSSSHLVTSYINFEELLQDVFREEFEELQRAEAMLSEPSTGAEISESGLVSYVNDYLQDLGPTVCCLHCFLGLSHDVCPW